jgi:hypothetical protein
MFIFFLLSQNILPYVNRLITLLSELIDSVTMQISNLKSLGYIDKFSQKKNKLIISM